MFFSSTDELQEILKIDNVSTSIIPKHLGGEYLLSYESEEIN